jgi:hypothetical protein
MAECKRACGWRKIGGLYMVGDYMAISLCNLEMANPTSPGKFTGDIEGLVVILMPGFLQW